MSDPREVIQKEAKQAYLKSNGIATLILPTGSGKSKVAIDIIENTDPTTVLILTNGKELRDTNWRNEFIKWGKEETWDEKVTSETYQKMYKGDPRTWDLIIYDEIDFACTTEYGKCFEVLKTNRLLGLTGFITPEKEAYLESRAPIIFKANVQDLQEDDILNKSEIILIEYPLELTKTLEQKLKTGGSFFVSENDQYKYWNKQFSQSVIMKTACEKKYRAQGIFNFEALKDWQALDWKFKSSAAKRKKLLHTLNSTVKVTNNILKHIMSYPDNKVLIFNSSTEVADKYPNPFHGKSDEDVKGIEALNNGDINVLSVVKKISRGVNLVGVNYLIRSTFDGSETEFNQSHGRGMRLKPGQVFKYIILLPLYSDLVTLESGRQENRWIPTQAQSWKNKMLQSLDVSPRVIRLDSTYQIKEGIII